MSKEKGFTLLISNENMDDILKFVESLEKSGQLIDGETETVKYEIKRQEPRSLDTILAIVFASLIAPVASSLIQPVASSLINAIIGKVQERGFLPFLALP